MQTVRIILLSVLNFTVIYAMDPTQPTEYADIVQTMQKEVINWQDWAQSPEFSRPPVSPQNIRNSTLRLLEKLKQKGEIKK